MRPGILLLLFVCFLAGGPPEAAATFDAGDDDPPSTNETDPKIVEVYPNPPAHGDPGEFVTVEFPPDTNVSRYAIADRTVEVALAPGNGTTTGERTRLTFSTKPEQTRRLTDRTVRYLPERIQLADRGDTIRLKREGKQVDSVSYGRATEATVYDARSGEFHPLGATAKEITEATGGEVEAFVLPDEPERPIEFLESAEERIYLAGYTLSSQRVVETVTEAGQRGVTVEVLVDGSPVGGMSGDAAAALDELDREGIDVRVIDGDHARYRFHHAKYAVVDDEALVTSENWKPSGTGGRSSRGWGVITDQPAIVAGLVETFHADTGWVDAIPWAEFDDLTLVDSDPAYETYPTAFEAQSFDVERTELLVAPDNAEKRILELIENAETSLRIKQVRIGDEEFPFLREVIDAAERGVEVEILLAGAWYVEEENTQLESYLEEQSEAGDLPLEVRVANPGDAFEKIHAKGLIVDGETTVVGSINWNNNSLRNNREVALLIESEGVATYFGDVFDSDWEKPTDDSSRHLPVGLALVALFVAVLAILGATRLEFEVQQQLWDDEN